LTLKENEFTEVAATIALCHATMRVMQQPVMGFDLKRHRHCVQLAPYWLAFAAHPGACQCGDGSTKNMVKQNAKEDRLRSHQSGFAGTQSSRG
jgi:hypothetical protein